MGNPSQERPLAASRRCKVCIASSAKQRAHRRISSPASWVLSLDTVGPFCKAEDEVTTSLRYISVACLLVPVDGTGKPVLGVDQEQANEDKASEPEPDHKAPMAVERPPPVADHDASAEVEEPPIPWAELWADDEVLAAVDEPVELVDDVALEACKKDEEGLTKAEKECQVPGLAWQEVVFTEVMRQKTPQAVCQALTRILTQIAALGFPVLRIHPDSGTEFVSHSMRQLVTKHSVLHTCSAPEEHKIAMAEWRMLSSD